MDSAHEYIRLLEEKTKLERKLKNKKDEELEKKEKDFKIYLQGANRNNCNGENKRGKKSTSR